MNEVIPYCIKNDPLKPDFVQECINDGSVRSYVKGPDSENMNDEESRAVMDKQDQYY